MSDFSIKDLQALELDMLSMVDRICSSLNIKYFLVGGTLLGAVRHKGFIPWDDDIDIGMLRKDYEIFIREAQNHLPSHLFVQNYKTDPNVPFNFTKIRDCRTTYIEKIIKNVKMNHGVFIDIFPIDYYPENKFVANLKSLILNLLAQYFFAAYDVEEDSHYYFFRKKIALFGSFFKRMNRVVAVREFIIKLGRKSKLMKNYSGAWGNREIVPAECFNKFIRLDFEGLQLMAPAAYDLYLRHIYGDYMTLPPVEKRVAHHYTDVIDLKHPYTNY